MTGFYIYGLNDMKNISGNNKYPCGFRIYGAALSENAFNSFSESFAPPYPYPKNRPGKESQGGWENK